MPLRRAVRACTIAIVAIALTGCATGVNLPASVESSNPPQPAVDAPALAQAQAWLDAANLPPGAVRTETSNYAFNVYMEWPCGPYEELEAYWVIPGMSVIDAANWLVENPTADLVTTSFSSYDDPSEHVPAAMIGYIPAPDAQEGIVYTLGEVDEGVAVRAEIAAQTDTATCPPLPGGATYGAPGLG